MKAPRKINISLLTIVTSVGIIISLLLHIYWYSQELPYSVELYSQKSYGGDSFEILREMDGDGYCELIDIGYAPNTNTEMTSILVRSELQKTINQMNIFHPIVVGDAVYFFDFNEDGFEEIFILSQEKDSLFLDGFDFFNNHKYFDNVKIMVKPDSALTESWDIMPSIAKIDGPADDRYMIFSITTGFAIYPRGVYKYSFNKLNIIQKFETAAPIVFKNVNIYDLDNDGKEEILYSSTSHENSLNLNYIPI
ncbi:MAG: hypothetical protein K9J12_14035 [Melioribacteraceae bacterium]|nr:hypothetical protein [Melioribacteraceae bacterium]MCF8266426.1 hypothetical protein [Melioribacteraceae bacterium]